MNAFQLSAILSPVCGAVGGATATKTSGGEWIALGMIVGGLFGIAVYFGARSLAAALVNKTGATSPRRRFPQWLASLTAVLLTADCPLVSLLLPPFLTAVITGS
jgi:hypothetical protein